MTIIEWDEKARDFMQKLPHNIANRIFKKVDNEIRNNVEHYLETLKEKDFYKIRVGDYRLFVDYYRDKDLLIIRAIRHRKDAYKKHFGD